MTGSYGQYFQQGGKHNHFGQSLTGLKYEPTRCVAGFDKNRREHDVVTLNGR